MASKEPPLAASAFGDIASWFVQSVARLRRAKQQFETNLKMVGDSMPGSIMAAAEASELNHLQYMASIALDVDLYAKAMEKLEEEKETAENQLKMLKENHIKDVKRFQDAMQQSECVCWQPLARVGLKTRKAWVLPAVEEAMSHRARLKTIIGCKDSDSLQVNVLPRYHFGTSKNKMQQSKYALPSLNGLTIVFYLCMCRKQARKAESISVVAAASGAGAQDADGVDSHADVNSEDSDADEDMHGYVDGVLPEALTSAYSVKSPLQKAAQLSVDWMQVDGELGLANPERRFLKRVFEHVPDREGKTESTHAMVLIPTEEEAGLNTTCLAEATMFKSGMYNNVLVPSHFVSCSKKAAYGAKRAMSESWKYDKSKLLQLESGTRFASSKVNRGQLGEGLRQEWMNDLVRVCNTKSDVYLHHWIRAMRSRHRIVEHQNLHCGNECNRERMHLVARSSK